VTQHRMRQDETKSAQSEKLTKDCKIQPIASKGGKCTLRGIVR